MPVQRKVFQIHWAGRRDGDPVPCQRWKFISDHHGNHDTVLTVGRRREIGADHFFSFSIQSPFPSWSSFQVSIETWKPVGRDSRRRSGAGTNRQPPIKLFQTLPTSNNIFQEVADHKDGSVVRDWRPQSIRPCPPPSFYKKKNLSLFL